MVTQSMSRSVREVALCLDHGDRSLFQGELYFTQCLSQGASSHFKFSQRCHSQGQWKVIVSACVKVHERGPCELGCSLSKSRVG